MLRATTLVSMFLVILMGIGSSEPLPAADALRLFLSEVQPGTMASQQSRILVFQDKHFHAEEASRKMGKDRERKVYEGKLTEAEWVDLGQILDSKTFQELRVAQTVPPLVMQDSHAYTISVSRGSKFQNLEFLDNRSRKPYDAQLKPLLKWWKSLRHGRNRESGIVPDSRCSLDNSRAIFTD